MTGSAAHASMKNFSLAKHIDSTKQKRQAVDRLVWKERKALMSKRVDGVELEGSFGSVNSGHGHVSLAIHQKA
jgi:hypothetical protein